MMLYTKYESSGPCRFRQEDIWKLHFENLFFIPVKCSQNAMSSFREEVVWMKKLMHWRKDTLTDDGQRTVTKAHSEYFVLRWAKYITK